ncbi:MAG: hypothetical protein R2845_07310 [Thermomicrobiales bacterium]
MYGLGAAALVGAKLASAQDSTRQLMIGLTGTSTDTVAADMEAQALAMYEVFLTSALPAASARPTTPPSTSPFATVSRRSSISGSRMATSARIPQ